MCCNAEKSSQGDAISTGRKGADSGGHSNRRRGEKRKALLTDSVNRKKPKALSVGESPGDSSVVLGNAPPANTVASTSAEVECMKRPLRKKQKGQAGRAVKCDVARRDNDRATRTPAHTPDVENGSPRGVMTSGTDTADDLSIQKNRKGDNMSPHKLGKRGMKAAFNRGGSRKKAAKKHPCTTEPGPVAFTDTLILFACSFNLLLIHER